MILRSMLYIPGNSMRMITKALTLAADAVILDLEDAVPLPDKETARIISRDSIKPIKSAGYNVFVRVNALATGLTAEDLNSVVVEDLDGIMLAKTETKSDVLDLEDIIEETGKTSGLNLENLLILPLIETAKGIVNAYEIASSSKRIVALAFGAGDYYGDLGRDVSALSPEETELLYARSQLVNAGRAAGVQAIDTPFLGLLTDREGFTRETVLGSRLGFKGKQVVHPTQIDFVNKTFSVTETEVEYAKRLTEAFEEAQAKGLGAISFEGKMIDYMSYKQAKEIVEFGEAVTKTEEIRQSAPPPSLLYFFGG